MGVPRFYGMVKFRKQNSMKYNEKADEYLDYLYKSVGATTWEQKFNTLLLKMGQKAENMSFSTFPATEVTWEQKAGAMEYELLDRMRLIELVLA